MSAFEKWIKEVGSGLRGETGREIRRREAIESQPFYEPGLIDVSGGFSSIGSKIMGAKLASAPKASRSVFSESPYLDLSPEAAALKARNIARSRNIDAIKGRQRVSNVAGASAFMAPDMIELMSVTR